MSRRYWGLCSALMVLLTLATAIPVAAQRTEPLPKQLEGVGITEHPGAQLPLDLEFKDEDGTPVRLAQYFTGAHPVILDLGYFRCPMLCPLVLTALVDGLRGVPWTPGHDFEILVVSIDPLDTPTLAKLKKEHYLTEYGRPGAADGWHFLTGGGENVKKLADAVGFHYRYMTERGQYAHAAGIFVATPKGRMARYLYGVEYPSKTLRLALTEAGKGTIGSTTDQLLLYCFHYDAQEGRYTLAASNLMRMGGAATLLIVGVWLFAAWRHGSHKKSPDQTSHRA